MIVHPLYKIYKTYKDIKGKVKMGINWIYLIIWKIFSGANH